MRSRNLMMPAAETRYRCLGSACVLYSLIPGQAWAYVGPGAGLSALGTVVALLGTVFLVIVGFVWYPLKRLLSRRKKSKSTKAPELDDDQATETDSTDSS